MSDYFSMSKEELEAEVATIDRRYKELRDEGSNAPESVADVTKKMVIHLALDRLSKP